MTVNIGSQRTQSLWRVVAFVYGLLVSFVTSIVVTVGFIWGVIDVIWQFITDRNDLSERSLPARIVTGVLRWNVDLLTFALTGDGEMQWLPKI
jgi:hypothetical protein